MPAKRKIKINTHFFGGKHKCALPVWITWKGLRKNVKIIHILKKAGYKIGLPFGTVLYLFILTYKKYSSIIDLLNLKVVEVFHPRFPTVNLRNHQTYYVLKEFAHHVKL